MAEESKREPAVRTHPKVVLTLLIVGALVTFLAIFSIWVNRQALNTDNWVNTSDKLLQNEAVRHQLANYLTNELYATVDVKKELEDALPPRLAPLASAAAGGLEQLTPKVAERVLESSQFQALWEDANRAAHEALLKILNGGGPAVSTQEGTVTLKLGALLKQVGSQLGVGGNLAEKLPPDAGELTVLESNELSEAQDAAKIVRRLPVFLTLLAVALFVLAVFLAGPRRREALRGVGIAFVGAGLLALALRSIAGHYVVDALASSATVEPAAEAVWSIGTSLLVTVAVSTLSFGILLILAAWIAGPTRYAVWLRRQGAPRLRAEPGLYYAGVAVLFVLLVFWAPIAALAKPLGILILALLLGFGAFLLRRQVLEEFPEEGTAGTTTTA